MKLPNLPKIFEKKAKHNYYLTLLLRDDKVTAVIMEEAMGKASVIGKHDESFKTSLEHASNEELLEVLDKAISNAEEKLPSNVETHNTIFGVKESWIEEKKIKKEYLLKLKKVSEELSMTPIGFLVTSEAIIHLIQKEEGAPISAILAEIGNKTITLSLFRASKLIEVQTAALTNHPVREVDNLLKEFTKVEVLPSRIILFSGKRDEHLVQEFISHQWSKSLPFLHVPQISILPSGFDAKAVVMGTALQLGFEVVNTALMREAKIANFEDEKPVHQPQHTDEPSEQTHEEDGTNEKTHAHESHTLPDEATTEPDTSDISSDNFGFIMDQDIADLPHPQPAHSKQHTDTERFENESFHSQPAEHDHNITDVDKEYKKHQRTLPGMDKAVALLAVIRARFSGVKVPQLPRSFRRLGKTKLIFIPILLLPLLIGSILLYIYQLKAIIVLNITPRIVEEKQTATFSTTSENNFSENIIAAQTISVTLDGSLATNTTGTKETGNKAKGTVTIFNSSTDGQKKLSQGSSISASNGLEFILDKDVTVASASGDAFSGTKPATADVSVTAKAIGSEYNFPANTKFTIAGSSTIAAKNDAAFSGGSKKEIRVVAKKDVDKLLAEIPKNLEKKAREELAAKISDDEALVGSFVDVTVSKKDFDKDVGEETAKVTLNGQVKYSMIAYQKQNVIEYAKTLLNQKYGDTITIPDERITTALEEPKEDETEVLAAVSVKADLLPKIETEKLKEDLKGKSFDTAKEQLSKLSQVENVTIKLKPDIPFLPKRLPRVSKNIMVQLQTQ